MTIVAVIGLGYVGLPLVVEFGKQMRTIGFDIAEHKVQSCKNGIDPAQELTTEALQSAIYAEYSSDPKILAEADVIIIAVPTPVDLAHIPDFKPLIGASATAGRYMKQDTVVIYESTVYPGATEEVCIPVLAAESGMQWKSDFFVGYSPERINPGDREHTLSKILKVVAGDTPATLNRVAELYEKIVLPGVHRCSSIKVAEACKVIENTQRDLNIALMNELAIIFDMLKISTAEVLAAAGTKWNFMPYTPGLVGGHCIGVDPYYLTHKAAMIGYQPQVILAGRRINDGMGKFIAEQTLKNMIACGSYVKGARVNILGFTFKKNCADIRNTKVVDVINELLSFGVEVFVHDPNADAEEAWHEYGIRLLAWEDLPRADAIIAAVAHEQFLGFTIEDFQRKLVKGGCFIDVMASFKTANFEEIGVKVWTL